MLYILLLILLPIAEIVLFVIVANQIGWLNSFLATVLTSAWGMYVIRMARYRLTGDYLRQQFEKIRAKGDTDPVLGAMAPVKSLLDGFAWYAAGILLFVPGFITDILGLLLLIPWTRKLFVWFLTRQLGVKFKIKTEYFKNMLDESDNFINDSNEEIIDVEYNVKSPDNSPTKAIDSPDKERET